MKTLIQGGTLFTPRETLQADILLEDGRITAVGKGLPEDGAEVVSAYDKYVLPGGVDAHTHVVLDPRAARGSDAFYRGTVPAAAGGTTAIIEHLGFRRDGSSLESELDEYRAMADGQAVVDYAFHGLLQGDSPADLASLESLRQRGVGSVKVYMTYDYRLNDDQLLNVLRRASELGLLTVVHAEDHAGIAELRARFISERQTAPIWHARSRPAEGEAMAVSRLLAIAAKAGNAPVYIAHLSTAAGLAAIKKARAAGQTNIFAETCTQYLTLTEEKYADRVRGLDYIMSPPLRTRSDVRALWLGIEEGDIQVVASDHCSFTRRDKMAGLDDFTACPNGAPGLEERLIVLFSKGVLYGRLSRQRFVQVTSENPARLFGLENKGAIRPGGDADLVIVNPNAERDIRADEMHGPGDYSIYEGCRMKARIEAVFLRGKLITRDGRFTGRRGQGQHIGRNL